MKRAIDLQAGKAFVVTDLHGAWKPYTRYRDHFLKLKEAGEADILIFLGDIIHGYGDQNEDYSLPILWDIMQLQESLGKDQVIMLLGNHELPHLYGVTLSKGDIQFTARFEHALGEYRPHVLTFLDRLPFIVRTAGGVLMTHAGAATSIAKAEVAQQLLDFSHQDLLAEADTLLHRSDVLKLLETYLNISAEQYDQMARYYMAVEDMNDPRYTNLLRGFIVGNLTEWQTLWDFFFNQCEIGLSIKFYEQVVDRFLEVYGTPEMPQRVLVTGHIQTEDGYTVIAGKQLRIASWTHAVPKESGRYLLFDVSQKVESAEDLLPFVYPIP